MHVSYWFGTAVGDLLFKGFNINSASGRHNSMLISFIAVCMGSICICSRQSAKIYFAEVIQMYDDSQKELSSYRYVCSVVWVM